MNKGIIPFQEGDWVRDSGGQVAEYRGPIYTLAYPAKRGLQAEVETRGLLSLGYAIDNPVEQADVQLSSGFTIAVKGDFPEWFQRNLKQVGISCTLIRPRLKASSST